MDYAIGGKAYLEHVGASDHDFPYEMRPCEVCGRESFTMIREKISLGKGAYGPLPVQACDFCGFLMQNPRFSRDFYQNFYRSYYRKMIAQSSEPDRDFIEDQKERGALLHRYLRTLFDDSPGTILDVGCSSGGFLLPFRDDGWTVMGSDPDEGFVKFGQLEWGLPIKHEDSEDMVLADESLDAVIIMGSLEHVFDPNIILEKCRKASKPNGIIVLEGRYSPVSYSFDYFNHNHHRYLREDSIEMLLVKHGWSPILNTNEPLCGPTRPGNGYCIGRVSNVPTEDEFERYLINRNRKSPAETTAELDRWDSELSNRDEA